MSGGVPIPFEGGVGRIVRTALLVGLIFGFVVGMGCGWLLFGGGL